MFHPRKRRGAALIEFAFWLPIVIMMLSGLLDFGWFMAGSQNVMQAARDGARMGAATRDDPDTGTNESVVAAQNGAAAVLSSMGLGCPAPSVTPGTFNSLPKIKVTVQCPYTPLLGAWDFLPTQMTYSFTMFLEVQPVP